jgi:hypothetical protein
MRDPQPIKAKGNLKRVFTDDVYYVSAAELADKIIDRMQRGLEPVFELQPDSSPKMHN